MTITLSFYNGECHCSRNLHEKTAVICQYLFFVQQQFTYYLTTTTSTVKNYRCKKKSSNDDKNLYKDKAIQYVTAKTTLSRKK